MKTIEWKGNNAIIFVIDELRVMTTNGLVSKISLLLKSFLSSKNEPVSSSQKECVFLKVSKSDIFTKNETQKYIKSVTISPELEKGREVHLSLFEEHTFKSEFKGAIRIMRVNEVCGLSSYICCILGKVYLLLFSTITKDYLKKIKDIYEDIDAVISCVNEHKAILNTLRILSPRRLYVTSTVIDELQASLHSRDINTSCILPLELNKERMLY